MAVKGGGASPIEWWVVDRFWGDAADALDASRDGKSTSISEVNEEMWDITRLYLGYKLYQFSGMPIDEPTTLVEDLKNVS